MKRCFIAILMFVSCLSIQTVWGQDSVDELSYASDDACVKLHGLPVVRTIHGGTKIIPHFEGNWSMEMRGAFEYACKIWEDELPTTYPLHIKVIMDDKTTSYKDKPVLSMVSPCCYQHYYLAEAPYTESTYTQIKSTKFIFNQGLTETIAYNEIRDSSILFANSEI